MKCIRPVVVLLFGLGTLIAQAIAAESRPNIIWITSEDNGPQLLREADSQAPRTGDCLRRISTDIQFLPFPFTPFPLFPPLHFLQLQAAIGPQIDNVSLFDKACPRVRGKPGFAGRSPCGPKAQPFAQPRATPW